MRHLGILLVSSIALAACASNNTPPPASAETVAQATDEPNHGPNFAPAASDGVATADSDARRSDRATQRAPTLGPTASNQTASNAERAARASDTANGTWGNANGTGVSPASGNAAAAPADPATKPSTEADNSRVNRRDRGETLTPMDQGSSESDRKMTQLIRQEVVKDKTLSFTAKNVKIITRDGRVTLRGPVKTEAERTAIEAAARKIAGSGAAVDSQLEIAK